MYLSVSQVALHFGVSENTVTTWVRERNLPAEIVNAHYRFDRVELLEWATLERKVCSPRVFRHLNGDEIDEPNLADALDVGGVLHDVAASDKATALAAAIFDIPLPGDFRREMLLELLLARESLDSTSIGDGMAIPHPRYPIVLSSPHPILRLCYLAKPLDFGARDGKPVDKLFVMICPTVHCHLQLLASLASAAVRDARIRGVLNGRHTTTQIVAAFRNVEGSLRQKTV